MDKIYLNEIQLDIEIEELLKHFIVYPNDVIFLAGSLIDGKVNRWSKGMGNLYSDLDIFILRDNVYFNESEATYSQINKKTDFTRFNSVGIDIEIYPKEFIKNLITEINSIDLNIDTRVANALRNTWGLSIYDINTFLNRFINSICIHNESEMSTLKKSLKIGNWLDFQKQFVINSIESKITDALGNVDVGNFEVAIFCTRNAFFDLIHYLVSCEGDLVDREKWLPLKFINILKARPKLVNLEKQYEELFYSDLTTIDKKRKAILDSLELIQKKLEEDAMEDLL